ncbi:hypothetical protein CCY99_02770 [Helicobacter sp. 16-1353]|uniref:hypothetical protein n=1 Tax=Helicobacter sp. 16-1353 TaxID=2004996 RepID=UPI000DCB2E87|nr:hypothetical protein [Helicobacter sp. 16-1353]RAX54702.1 hypothetical protein CCY99_02770 [Helicobacter sp. 16-1353]
MRIFILFFIFLTIVQSSSLSNIPLAQDSTRVAIDTDLQNQVFNQNKDSTQDSNKQDSKKLENEIWRKIFPNKYIEDTFTGFIDTIEDTLLMINIRRIAIDFSNTSINVSDVYRELEINQFSGDNTTVASAVADLALEYNFENSRLSNTLYAEYGLIILSPKYEQTTKTETADNFILNTGYTRKSFMFEKGFFGPFIDGEYQTEFTKKEDGSRNQYLRYKAGARFLDGKYIDELYLAGVGEIDFSYKPSSIKGAVELGLRAKTPINDDIKLVYQGFTRQYVGYSRFRESDLIYNVNLNMRLDVSIYKGFAFSPFISARFAKIRGASSGGNNIMTGISLMYSSSINAISSIQSTQNEKLKQYYKSIND